MYCENGFYLIPITAVRDNETATAKITRFWEAWGEVLGLPGPAAEIQRQAEIAQLDLAWRAEATSGTRGTARDGDR